MLLDAPSEWNFTPDPNSREARFLKTSDGLPIFLKRTVEESKELPNFSFERHFNPDLTIESVYFQRLKDTINCVKRNAERELSAEEEETVCAREYKRLRLAAL